MTTLIQIAEALACPTRVAILHAIAPNKTLGELADEVGVVPSTLSFHVSKLADAGLIMVDGAGTKKYLRRRYSEVRFPLT